MSLKYSNVKGILHQQRMNRSFIKELTRMGVTHSEAGKSIYDMDYDELKEQLVLAAFREIDAEKDSNRWF